MPCAPGTAFVTILDGTLLFPQLKCMHERLLTAGSACPLLVIAHGSALMADPMKALHALVGQSNVIPSSKLLARQVPNATVPVSGRRLYTDARAFFAGTMILKLHLWGLIMYTRLAFLDLDTVIMNNLDSLLTLPISYQSIAAVPTKVCKRINAFNSGVIVLAPNREVMRAMLLRACMYFWRAAPHARADVIAVFGSSCTSYRTGPIRGRDLTLQKACEKRVTDQSVINYHFRNNWYSLDDAYNISPRDFRPNISVLHFAGEPKPWGKDWKMTHMHFIATKRAGLYWKSTCHKYWKA